MGEPNAAFCKSVDVRGLVNVRPIASDFCEAQVICKNEYNAVFLAVGACCAEGAVVTGAALADRAASKMTSKLCILMMGMGARRPTQMPPSIVWQVRRLGDGEIVCEGSVGNDWPRECSQE